MSEDTVRTPRHVLLEETISTILEALRVRPATPFTRELITEAERYRLVIAGWESAPPSDHQRSAMFDCVVALRSKVAAGASLSVAPDVPPREYKSPDSWNRKPALIRKVRK